MFPSERVVHGTEEHAANVGSNVSSHESVEREGSVEERLGRRALLFCSRDDASFEQLPQRGHADHRGHSRFFHRRGEPLAVELIEINNPSAARERQKHSARELEGVVQREHRQRAIAGLERKHRAERAQQRDEISGAVSSTPFGVPVVPEV